MTLHAAPLSQYSTAITLVVREFVLALPVEPDIWPVPPLLECADRDDVDYVLGPVSQWHPGKVNGIRAFVDPSGSRVPERLHVACLLHRIFPSRYTSVKPMRWPSAAAITVTPRNAYRMRHGLTRRRGAPAVASSGAGVAGQLTRHSPVAKGHGAAGRDAGCAVACGLFVLLAEPLGLPRVTIASAGCCRSGVPRPALHCGAGMPCSAS